MLIVSAFCDICLSDKKKDLYLDIAWYNYGNSIHGEACRKLNPLKHSNKDELKVCICRSTCRFLFSCSHFLSFSIFSFFPWLFNFIHIYFLNFFDRTEKWLSKDFIKYLIHSIIIHLLQYLSWIFLNLRHLSTKFFILS